MATPSKVYLAETAAGTLITKRKTVERVINGFLLHAFLFFSATKIQKNRNSPFIFYLLLYHPAELALHKRAYLYQIAVRVGHIAGALPPRFSGGRKNGLGTIFKCMQVSLIHISEGGHVEGKFHCAVKAIGILELLRHHLLKSVTREEDDAHIA